ncbi:MAG: thioredoxin [Proteobacteria bacterium]|nr:thioredoxin [Pseudomonadota bacterium]
MKIILKFTAAWCQPCKVLDKVLSVIDFKTPIQEIDLDKSKELANFFNIRGVPTMIMLENGKEIKRLSGFPGKPGDEQVKKNIEEWLNT